MEATTNRPTRRNTERRYAITGGHHAPCTVCSFSLVTVQLFAPGVNASTQPPTATLCANHQHLDLAGAAQARADLDAYSAARRAAMLTDDEGPADDHTLTGPTATVTITAAFYDDHVSRGCRPGVEIGRRASLVTVTVDQATLDDLRSDAAYYSDHREFDRDLFGVCASARATARRLADVTID